MHVVQLLHESDASDSSLRPLRTRTYYPRATTNESFLFNGPSFLDLPPFLTTYVSPGILREGKHPRSDVLLLLRLLRRKGHQQGPGTEPESAHHEDHSQQRVRVLEHEISDGVRGGQVAVLRRASTNRLDTAELVILSFVVNRST